MPADAATRPQPAAASSVGERARRLFERRVWLPRPVYVALPWLYLGGGSGALFAGLFLPGDSWIMPYALLLGGAGLHAGAALARLRRRLSRRARGLSAVKEPVRD